MWARIALLIVLSSLGLVGCASDDREWMRVAGGSANTKQEFQRDYRECTRKGALDEACMRQRGWVPVNPVKPDAPKSMDPLPSRGRGRY
jgi:hypothetical protein